jgi:Spy/CpxP family protein refolding chaperone
MVVAMTSMAVLSGAVPALSGMKGRQTGQPGQAAASSAGEMMGSGAMEQGEMGGMQGMRMPRPGQMVRLLKRELGLSDDQAKRLREIFSAAMKARIQQQANLRIAELELRELLEAEPVEMGQVETQLKAIEGLRTALRFDLIKAHEQAKAELTPEQRQQLERLHDRRPGMMGPAMMGMMEMMGEGGMGMMGPQMRQHMMHGMTGGGTEGQAQTPRH